MSESRRLPEYPVETIQAARTALVDAAVAFVAMDNRGLARGLLIERMEVILPYLAREGDPRIYALRVAAERLSRAWRGDGNPFSEAAGLRQSLLLMFCERSDRSLDRLTGATGSRSLAWV